MKRVKELLQTTNPDLDSVVEIALKQERLQHEKQNKKVLEMFAAKDVTITELERKLEEVEVNIKFFVNMSRKTISK